MKWINWPHVMEWISIDFNALKIRIIITDLIKSHSLCFTSIWCEIIMPDKLQWKRHTQFKDKSPSNYDETFACSKTFVTWQTTVIVQINTRSGKKVKNKMHTKRGIAVHINWCRFKFQMNNFWWQFTFYTN